MKSDLQAVVGFNIQETWFQAIESRIPSHIRDPLHMKTIILDNLVASPIEEVIDRETPFQLQTVEIDEDFFVHQLTQSLLLEIKDAANVSKNYEGRYKNSEKRCLKLVLTNGIEEYLAFEETPLELRLDDLTKLVGKKLFLRPDVEVRRTVFVLRRENADFILSEADVKKMLQPFFPKGVRMEIEQDPNQMMMTNNLNPDQDIDPNDYIEYFNNNDEDSGND